ncbi:MAG TPA: exopolyphosphatase [Acidimicrobiales bacterium]|nr:exopolyphosphatase [Acidimicrobiales bacterium]
MTERSEVQQARSAVARAAIDIGTNSTNLLVVHPDGRRERWVNVTRLGQGVNRDRRFAPEAVERTLGVLREYRARLDERGIGSGSLRVGATSGSRDAEDREEFFARAAGIVGAVPDLLSGTEEARLAFRGATADLDPELGPFLVVDIGGGSTELALGHDEPTVSLSMDVGAVRLTESELHEDPPAAEELANAIAVVQAHLDEALLVAPELAEARTVVGIAGTITTVAAVELGLVTYDADVIHGFVLTRDAAEDVFRTLATEPLADRVHNPGLPRARADVIVGGCCVLVTILRRLHLPGIRISDRNILDGLVESLARTSGS